MEYIIPIATLLIGSAISYFTARSNQKKITAEVNDIYGRLGIDREKSKADNANTWMDVARKAAQEYERVLKENGALKEENAWLKKKITGMDRKINLLKKRLQTLEMKKKRARL